MEFTRYSKMRMLRLIAKIDWSKFQKGLFVTLTYPDSEFSRSYLDRTEDRTLFHRWVETISRKHVPSIWRTEWVERRSGEWKGALMPHHHFMLMGINWIHRTEVNAWWANHLGVTRYVRTETKAIKGADGCGRYLCKYMTKVPSLVNGAYLDSGERKGRQWGMLRKNLIPMMPIEFDDEISQAMYATCREVADEMESKERRSTYGSFSILGEIRKEAFIQALQTRVDKVGKIR